MNVEGSQPHQSPGRRRVIMTGDDFGLNSQVNEAIEQAYQHGVLTQTSLMVNEGAVDEAVRIAQRNPGLVVGLHLSLCCGRASKVSALTDRAGNLPGSPALAGMSYAFRPGLRDALSAEIAAQFHRFAELGFPPIYWDGHTHLHLHPTILKLTLPVASQAGFGAVRLVQERGGGVIPAIFRRLSAAAIPKLDKLGIVYTDRTFGLNETGRVDTRTLEEYIEQAPEGWSEIYWHPGADPRIDYGIVRELVVVERARLVTAQTMIEERREGV